MKFDKWKLIFAAVWVLANAPVPTQAQTFTTLATFDGSNGSYSLAPLVQGTDGNLYGTTNEGGAKGLGTTFRITPDRRLMLLHSFCTAPSCSDGKEPDAALTQAPDGNLYGTTESGGNGLYGAGTIFKITPTGKLTTLYKFGSSSLIQAIDGNVYGTIEGGGANGFGTVFKITPRGNVITLYNFCSQPNCADGSLPRAGLLEGADGNLYGTTYGGNNQCSGSGTCGTVFKITQSGQLTTLHRFCAQPSCTDGADPYAGLAQDTEGNFYGTTEAGGTCDGGTVFKVTSSGQFTTLYSFCGAAITPQSTLARGTDGNFYGTTNEYSSTIFRITPGGDLTSLYTFCSQPSCADGYDSFGLVQGTDGAFYGTTAAGGDPNCNQPYGCGTVFRFSTGLPPFVAFVQPGGRIGQTAEILGQGFTGTSSVMLNGVPTNFTIVSDTYIKATVPPGATTGYVTVTTPTGVLTSNVPFHVIP
jgi:uncharacterized repeat protein (TIGR03803 family)